MITNSTYKSPSGLRSADIPALHAHHGRNVLTDRRKYRLLKTFGHIIAEPMFVLLLFATGLYFLLGSIAEGFMMIVAILLVSAISFYQEVKSENALEALRQYTASLSTVIRDGKETQVPSSDLVPDDIILLQEGELIPADALVISSNDFTVNESILTGEAYPVEKNAVTAATLFHGTTVNSGSCIAKISETGDSTLLGKLGKSISGVTSEPTLLQRQTSVFVRQLATFGILGCIVVFVVNFARSGNWSNSFLLGLTLAMAAIPEEIPVSFSSFMALGAYYMSRMGIIPRQAQIIENLGAANVLCLDKTGTLTENRMKAVALYDYRADIQYDLQNNLLPPDNHVLFLSALACEKKPFDQMEKAILEAFHENNARGITLPPMIHEYPLEGKPPMMTHVYNWNGVTLAAGKGAIERILQVCQLSPIISNNVLQIAGEMGNKGYRVLGIATAVIPGTLMPARQDDAAWQFSGLLALYDPPRKGMPDVIATIKQAGIRPMLLTGDHAATAAYIAGCAGIAFNRPVTGDDVMNMQEPELRLIVQQESLFVRMFPDAKQRVIEALKADGGIVAMTGDGVNDGPAIKAANIGIAMGQKGTEIARQAADLVITDDNLSSIPIAIEQGRKIYSNLKKAIRYIISIHIPIILVAAAPLLLNWKYVNIFSPVHVIFLELIMGPTCSLFFEKEPVESNLMRLPPRKATSSLFTGGEMTMSVIQGLVITSGILTLYALYMQQHDIAYTRSIVFICLILCNVLLTFTNRSFTANINVTMRYHNVLTPYIPGLSVVFVVVLQLIPAVRDLFGLKLLSLSDMGICLLTALICTGWPELYKIYVRRQRQ
ncbi:Ca2+-transporting ATPase [Chitinophaga sp. YR627]|uniref:cation-translocating P-type ATPase n=1 Tax=Chitinophaga sp. YR627 TaxID=1881041 RepID=UPI0008EE1BC8|nr:cation-translocating P-type ATPase [Chitinophaga sp. YR627]SFM70893.1 Ca2+-transporting ATPase [Chitinophaga sp. YR627]